MVNIATVKYEADSSQVRTATKDLKGQTQAARNAKAANDNLASSAGRARDAYGRFVKQTGAAKNATDTFAKSSVAASLAVGRFDRATGLTVSTLTKFATAAGLAIGAAFSVAPVFEFSTAMAEVSTLVDTATFDMAKLEKGALSLSSQFGGSAAAQTKAYYQIISAGAGTAAQATETLTAANKLAVGGVTDVTTAADGLTSVLNAYGSKVESATAVSDALFVGMRAGKTTIAELSSSLGKVAPLAAATGVGFDELVAATSALTKGGISTSESVTGIRAVLAAVAKPTKEASELAKALGLDFNSAALESKGLAGFIKDLTDKTGGSTDALSLLFGGVEALVPIMALSGQAGQDFNIILADMATKAGQTEAAVEKMTNTPAFQAGRVWGALTSEVLSFTNTLAGPLATALMFTADNMHLVTTAITTAGQAAIIFGGAALAVKLASWGAAALAFAANLNVLNIALLAAQARITLVTKAATLARVAMIALGGPIGIVVGLLGAGAAAWLLYKDDMDKTTVAMNDAREGSAKLQEMLAGFTDQSAPAAGKAAIDLANDNYALADSAYAAASAELAKQKALLQIASTSGVGGTAGSIKEMGISPGLVQPGVDAATAKLAEAEAVLNRARIDRETTVRKVTGSTYESVNATNKLATSSKDLSGILAGLNDKTGKSAKKTKEAKDSLNEYQQAVASTRDAIKGFGLEQQVIGLTAFEAEKLRKETELLNAAEQAKIPITETLRNEVAGLATEYARSSASLETAQQAIDDRTTAIRGALGTIYDSVKRGGSVWDGLKTAALNALDSIVNKALDAASKLLASGLFGGNGFGGFGGFGGASISPTVSGVAASGGVGLFSSGGYTGGGGVNQVAGLVHGQEYVMNARAVKNIGVSNLNRMQQTGRIPTGAPANQNGKLSVSLQVTSDSEMFNVKVQEIALETSAGVVKQASPQIVNAAVSKTTGNINEGKMDGALGSRFGSTPKAVNN